MSASSLRAFLAFWVLLLATSPRAAAGGDPPARAAAARAFEKANALYDKEDFPGALAEYERLAGNGFATREVLANAANAAYRAGDIGRAVLYYCRALRVDPSYARARENLLRIQPATNIAPHAGFAGLLAQWLAGTRGVLWLAAAEGIFLWLLVALVRAIRAAPATEDRSTWRARAAGAAILAALAFGLCALQAHLAAGAGNAVVLRDKTISRLGPGERFFEQLEIPAGTIVTTRGLPKTGWIQVVLRDGSSGYVPTGAIEPI